MSSTSLNNVRIALVVETESYDEGSVEVVDIIKMAHVGGEKSFTYVIKTRPFNDRRLQSEAGERFTDDEKVAIENSPLFFRGKK